LSSTEDDVGLLLRTSGTTSKPKGVPLGHGQIVRNGAVLASSLELTAEDVCLNAMPLFHIGGISASIMGTMLSKGQVTCLNGFTAESFVAALAKSQQPSPTWYSSVPTIHNAVVANINQMPYDNHTIRLVRSGAAALLAEDAANLEKTFNAPVITTYSMSEQMPISQPPAGMVGQQSAKPGSVGVPVAASLAIVDDDMIPLPYGEKGNIAIGGPTVLQGYLENPLADMKSFFVPSRMGGLSADTPKRFFLTGDVGVIDGEGHLSLKGRTKELIKRGGEQISPYEVEDVFVKHPWISLAVVFSVPSKAWGEEVGVAMVLSPNTPETHTDKEVEDSLRKFCAEYLERYKIPTHYRVVQDEDLPKTNTRKYKRIGLADVLGVVEAAPLAIHKSPPAVSTGLAGLRFFLACWVMFNHIGAKSSWGDVHDTRYFCMHVPTFFALSGFTLSSNMPRPAKDKLAFAFARFRSMHPIYILSIVLNLINLVCVCNPNTFVEEFNWNKPPAINGIEPDLTRGNFCEQPPAGMGWGATLTTSTIIYLLGIQSWPIWYFSWWVSYYSWFSSVYYFCLFSYPWLYSCLYSLRGKRTALLAVLAGTFLLNWGIISAFAATMYTWYPNPGPNDSELYSQLRLNFYLFPPFWLPCFGSGIIAAFIYDAYRPAEQHGSYLWGWLTDGIAFALACNVFLDTAFFDDSYPSAVDTASDVRVWAATLSRIYLPIMVLFLYAIAVGRGYVVQVLSTPFLVDVLAPNSYNCYLFHQTIGFWYWGITRQEIWSYWRYRKGFYWFSPHPVPCAWYEYFYVVTLVVLWSMLMSKYVDPVLVVYFNKAWRCLKGACGGGGVNELDDKSTASILLAVIEELTGQPVELENTLEECGLASVGAPVLAQMLSEEMNVSIQVKLLVSSDTIAELAEHLDAAVEDAAHIGV